MSDFTEQTLVKGDQTRVAYSPRALHRYLSAGWSLKGAAPKAKRPTKAAVKKAREAGRRRTAASAAPTDTAPPEDSTSSPQAPGE